MTGWNINVGLPGELRDIKSRFDGTPFSMLASRCRHFPVFPYKTVPPPCPSLIRPPARSFPPRNLSRSENRSPRERISSSKISNRILPFLFFRFQSKNDHHHLEEFSLRRYFRLEWIDSPLPYTEDMWSSRCVYSRGICSIAKCVAAFAYLEYIWSR